jgi:Rrf2 family protein
VLYMTMQTPGEVIEAGKIAEEMSIPERFVLKIMRLLVKGGIVRSYQGVGGGYALAREADQITLRDVLEAVEGPIKINRCLIDPAFCNRQGAEQCAVHRSLASIQQVLAREFGKYNFAQLARGEI